MRMEERMVTGGYRHHWCNTGFTITCTFSSSRWFYSDTTDKMRLQWTWAFILQGTPESPQVSVADQQEVKDKDVPSCIGSQLTAVLPEPMPPTVSHSRDDYVLLPNPGLSKSTEELVTHGNLNNNYHTTKVEGSERTGQGLKGEEQSPTVLLLGHNEGEPPSYTPMQFPIAPQGGTVQPSGYCFLPSTIPM